MPSGRRGDRPSSYVRVESRPGGGATRSMPHGPPARAWCEPVLCRHPRWIAAEWADRLRSPERGGRRDGRPDAMLFDPVRLAGFASKAAALPLAGARSALGRAWRYRVIGTGIDITRPSSNWSCLVVAAHADDAVLGCGATIARKVAAGSAVWVAIATTGRCATDQVPAHPRVAAERQARATRTSLHRLGVPEEHVHLLGFESGTLGRCGVELAATVTDLVRAVQPDEVLVPWELDADRDHRAIASAWRWAAAGPPAAAAAYPVSFWSAAPWHAEAGDRLKVQAKRLVRDSLIARRLPTARVVVTGEYADQKHDALEALSHVEVFTDASPLERWSADLGAACEPTFPLERPSPGPDASAHRRRAPRPAVRASKPPNGPAATLTAARDDFGDDRPPGRVLGTRSTSGTERLGVDVERTLSIDHGELRMATLATPGFGRQGTAYGPFHRVPGLTLAVQVLNSHNTAQSNILPEGRKAMLRRLVRDFPHGKVSSPHLDDNLVVGFFPEVAPADPRGKGNVFVMHAASTTNGELRALVGTRALRAFNGIQEVPLTYVVVLREHGAAYFVSSVEGVEGATPFPLMRPVAVDHAGDDQLVFAGLMQAVHGEVGHEIATRVSAVRAEVVPALLPAAMGICDDLRGEGPMTCARPGASGGAAQPGAWAGSGEVVRSQDGAHGGASGGSAEIELPWPAGLVHVVVETAATAGLDARAGLVWRAGPAGAWRVTVDGDGAHLEQRDADGRWATLERAAARLGSAASWSLQVVDDGEQFGVHLDGDLLFGRWFDDDRFAHQTFAGFVTGPAGPSTVHDFEALPRAVPLPDLALSPPWCERGTDPVVDERFAGPAGELSEPWERSVGHGRVMLDGDDAARVVADADHPNPGRTAYTLPWEDPSFADIEVTMTPPGAGRGDGHAGRGGLVFFEDPDTYLIVNVWLDDAPIHDGSSVSLFFRTGAHERLYDAVWTNVGRRVTWGKAVTLRLVFDGLNILVWLDGVPVLSRRTQDIYPAAPSVTIKRVGLVANWEWGDDTGTTFHSFVARRRPRP
ncbi:MAG: hypothetical protein GEV08_21210 [Acidimicrobiia bacterium]|nr:hypothetical protein [Acidimicrobiia bacterium]